MKISAIFMNTKYKIYALWVLRIRTKVLHGGNMAEIGNGFDSATHKEKPLSIFSNSLKTQKEPYIKFDFSSFIYRNTADYLRKLAASSALSAGASQSMSLTAALEFSSDLRRNQDDLIYVIHICGIRQKESSSINEAAFETDPQIAQARNLLKERPMDFWNKYGDSYISSIYYGKEVAIVINFKKDSAANIQKQAINLEAKFADIGNLKQAVDFLKSLSKNDLKCEIFIQAKGFDPDQLPPSDPSSFGELSKWLSDFEKNFSQINPNQINTPIGFDAEAYTVIFPREAMPVVAHGELKGKYMQAIHRCNQVADFYIAYYNWLGDYNSANDFSLKKEALGRIKATIEKRSTSLDPSVVQASNALAQIIVSLNEAKIDPKLVNSFLGVELSGNISDGDIKTRQQISKSFQIAELPPGDGANFTFKINNSAPLKGKLSFFYSLDKKVGYNSGSHRIASEISPNTVNKAELPSSIDKNKIQDIYFAYHYDQFIPGTWERIRRHLPGYSGEHEDFSVETYLGSRKPAPILSIA